MIRIFNIKEERAILIDEKSSMVTFYDNDWNEENPHLVIELKGFHFSHHAMTCEDCGAFQKAFGTKSTDWFIDYPEKTKRLDLSNFGKTMDENQMVFRISEFDNGTKMKLNIDADTVESLGEKLKVHLDREDYEGCCKIRDKINAISS